ncbi:hypothetical protein KM043_005855 [Ampulex compressa]|nr:hypothetical protein KM043_005855 [Ampulex compressa]
MKSVEGEGVALRMRRYASPRWQHCRPRNKSHPCRVERERQERKPVRDGFVRIDKFFGGGVLAVARQQSHDRSCLCNEFRDGGPELATHRGQEGGLSSAPTGVWAQQPIGHTGDTTTDISSTRRVRDLDSAQCVSARAVLGNLVPFRRRTRL